MDKLLGEGGSRLRPEGSADHSHLSQSVRMFAAPIFFAQSNDPSAMNCIRPSDDRRLDRLIPCWLPGRGGVGVAVCGGCPAASHPITEASNGGSARNAPTGCDAVQHNTCRAITRLRRLITRPRIARPGSRVTLLIQVERRGSAQNALSRWPPRMLSTLLQIGATVLASAGVASLISLSIGKRHKH